MREKVSTLWIALQLIRLHFRGWKQVPGYTVVRKEPGGDVYFAVQLSTDA